MVQRVVMDDKAISNYGLVESNVKEAQFGGGLTAPVRVANALIVSHLRI